jgi:hypothetical protein
VAQIFACVLFSVRRGAKDSPFKRTQYKGKAANKGKDGKCLCRAFSECQPVIAIAAINEPMDYPEKQEQAYGQGRQKYFRLGKIPRHVQTGSE